MKKFLKWGGISLLAFIILAAIFGEKKPNATAAVAAESKIDIPAIEVSGKEIMAAYKDNEVAANMKYKDKPLTVSAKIDDIQAGLGDKPFLVLATGEEIAFNKPQAHLADGQDAKVAVLKKGQTVALSCVGGGEVAGTPMLSDCKLN